MLSTAGGGAVDAAFIMEMNQNASASGASEQAKIKRRRHRKPGKDMVYRCLVCEDVALNYNFTVITCESCKAFFRRNVDTPNRFHCPNHYSCKVTKETRKHCPACRLKKCFDVGMRKELPGAGGEACAAQGHSAYEVDIKVEEDLMSHQGGGMPHQHSASMAQSAAFTSMRMMGGVPGYQIRPTMDVRMLANASPPSGNINMAGIMNPMGNYPAANGPHPFAGWRGGAANTMHAQMDSMAMQLGGVALSGSQQMVAASGMGSLRVTSSTSSSSFDTGHSETPAGVSANTNLAALNSVSGSDALLPCRSDVDAVSPPSFSGPPSACTLSSPFSSLEQGAGWAGASQPSSSSALPIKHRLKRLRSPNDATSTSGQYESPASNTSSSSSVDSSSLPPGSRGTMSTGHANAASAGTVPSPSGFQFSMAGYGISDSPSSTVFDRDGACASSSALLNADDFKQALETCTRFSTMMQAPFSTSELGALLSNPLPENAFESSVYAEMALRRYVHSLKRLDEFARLDRTWQLFVLRRALITAHSVNVGFYTDVERRAFLSPREDGSCLYLNEAYFYRTFDRVRSGALDFGTLMKPLMDFHVSLQLQFSTQWTIVLAAMSLAVLFSTHYYVTPPSSATATSSTASPSAQSTPTAPQERQSSHVDEAAPQHTNESHAHAAPPHLASAIQQFARMAGLKLPANLDLRNLDLASLAQHFPGIDLQALGATFQQMAAHSQGAAASGPSGTAAQPHDAAAAPGPSALEGLEAFGLSPSPAGLLDSLEPLHRKYLYFLHDYVLMLHSNAEEAASAWRICSEKLEEVRRIAGVFTQQAFLFIAQNPQLGGMLVPLLNEIISSTPP